MPITKLLERNAREYGDEVALVEINPDVREIRRVTWKEYELIETGSSTEFRREITWSVFDEKANRCANLLMSRGIRRGHKVAILLMNCLEWLHPQDRRAGGSAELPLFGRGDSLLLRSGRRGRAAVRPGVHRPRGGSR